MRGLARRKGWIALAAAMTAAACATGRPTELEPRYVAVHNALAAMGLSQIGPIHQGSLAEGRETRVRLELPAQCTTVVALGGVGVRDLDVTVLDDADRPLAHDTTKDAQAAVRTCPEKAGVFTLVVKMAQGSGDFVAATWAGAISTSPGASPASSPTQTASGAGNCDSPILLTAGDIQGSTRRGDSEHSGTCVSSEGKELVYKLEVPHRQRATIEVDPQFDSVLYVRKDDCAESESEIACNDDVSSGGNKKSSSRGSRIDEVLEAGTYYVFVDGYGSEGGNFRMNVQLADVPTLADACQRMRPITSAKTSAALAPGAFDSGHASCADEAKGPDAIHRLDVSARSRVRVVHHSDDFSPVLHLRKTCTDDKSEVGCTDSGLKSEEAAFVGVLDPGAYALFADSSDKGSRGRYTLDVDVGSERGSGVKGDACGDAITLGANEPSVEGDTFEAKDDIAGKCSGPSAPDVVYRFDVPRRSRVTARFTAEEGSHVFALYGNCTDRSSEIACSASIDEMLAPGTYWLAVDGGNREAFGRFTFALAARDVSAQEGACRAPIAIVPGQKITGTTANAGNKFTTSCGGREDAQSSPDRVYRLSLTSRMTVRLLLTTPTWDGVLALRKSCLDPPNMRSARNAEVACNNDSNDTRHSKIETTLEAGTYFVVVDGHAAKNEGAYTLEYSMFK